MQFKLGLIKLLRKKDSIDCLISEHYFWTLVFFICLPLDDHNSVILSIEVGLELRLVSLKHFVLNRGRY